MRHSFSYLVAELQVRYRSSPNLSGYCGRFGYVREPDTFVAEKLALRRATMQEERRIRAMKKYFNDAMDVELFPLSEDSVE